MGSKKHSMHNSKLGGRKEKEKKSKKSKEVVEGKIRKKKKETDSRYERT